MCRPYIFDRKRLVSEETPCHSSGTIEILV